MIDSVKLQEAVQTNVETLCRHFFPAGEKIINEWHIGGIGGERGKSLGIVLSQERAGVWHDRATGQAGTFVQLIMASRNLQFPDAVSEIERALGLSLQGYSRTKPHPAYVKPDVDESHGGTNGASEKAFSHFDWTKLPRLNADDQSRLAAWRAYSPKFVNWMVDQDLIRVSGNNGSRSWAFPIKKDDRVQGVHSRSFTVGENEGPKWKIWPVKAQGGPGIQPFVIGDISHSRTVHLFESQWDQLSVCDKLGLHETDGFAAVSTRGAGNARLAQILPDSAWDVYVWAQNDEAGKSGHRISLVFSQRKQ